MVAASLIATISKEDLDGSVYSEYQDEDVGPEGEETTIQFMNGESLWEMGPPQLDVAKLQASTRPSCSS